jgi:regulator of sigma E protease
MLTILSPLIVLGIVVFVHEMGHFLAAKSVGVYAPVFALGWGSRLIGFRRGETDYRIAWLPIGGYVQMASANDETMRLAGHAGQGAGGMVTDAGLIELPSAPDSDGPRKGINPVPWDPNAMHPFGPRQVPQERWMESKPLWARLWVLSAGVLMNFVLAFLVLVLMGLVWGNARRLPVTGEVQAGSPAAAAGLVAGDRITAVNGAPVQSWDEMVSVVRRSAAQPVELTVDRRGTAQRIVVQPRAVDGQDEVTGKRIRVGQIGVLPGGAIERVPLGPGQAVGFAWDRGTAMFGNVLQVLKGLANRDVSVKQLGGPIAIARTSVAAAREGVETLLGLIAFLSINIAILNLLPIPVLDGGQMLYAIAERARGRPFSERTRERFFQVGTMLVLLLIVTVMWNDIVRWVTGSTQ